MRGAPGGRPLRPRRDITWRRLAPGPGPRFTPRDPPDGDVATYLRRTMGFDMWPYRCRVRLHAPATQITGHIDGIVTPIDTHTCRLELATDSFALVALVLGMLDVDFEVESPPELTPHLRNLSRRFADAGDCLANGVSGGFH